MISNLFLEPNEFTLHHNPTSEIDYPVDRNGDVTLLYAGRHYKFKKEYLKYSQLLQALWDNDRSLENFKLKYEYSPEAFRIVMKLLFGFSNVIIPDQRLMQTYAIIEEMRIDNQENFHNMLEKYVLNKLERNGAFVKEAYDISLRIENEKIKSKCLEITNIVPTFRNIPDYDIPSTLPPPQIPVSPTAKLPDVDPMEQLDEFFEQPKAKRMLRLIGSCFFVYFLLAICLAYMEDSSRRIKFLQNGVFKNHQLVCDNGYVFWKHLCIPENNQAIFQNLTKYAEDINTFIAIQNGRSRCNEIIQNIDNLLKWDDIKQQIIKNEGMLANRSFSQMLDAHKNDFDYIFENLRHTAIFSQKYYVTSDEIFPNATCSLKLIFFNYKLVTAMIIGLIILHIYLLSKLFNSPKQQQQKKAKKSSKSKAYIKE